MIKQFSLFLQERYRQSLLKRTTLPQPLSDYLSYSLYDKNTAIKDLEFLVLDFETTGLRATKEKIISIGYTVIKQLHLIPTLSTHILVNPKQELEEENVSIHQLTDDELCQGLSLSKAINKLLLAMSGRVIVVHFDKIEKGFLNQACHKLYKINYLPMIMLDTLKIEQAKLQRTQQQIKSGGLRLSALRNAYNLPRYKAHNAMQDAISTAELFLAQIDYMGDKHLIKLNTLL